MIRQTEYVSNVTVCSDYLEYRQAEQAQKEKLIQLLTTKLIRYSYIAKKRNIDIKQIVDKLQGFDSESLQYFYEKCDISKNLTIRLLKEIEKI